MSRPPLPSQRRNITRSLAVTLAAAALLPAQSLRAQAFPSRTVRLVVPYSAGQGADISARLIAERLSRRLGQPVIVENRAGAGGNIGATVVANAPADGYTLLYGTNATNAANAALYDNPGFTPDAFTAVSMINRSPMVISVRAGSDMRSIEDVFARARAKPGEVSVGIPSTTSAVVLGELEHVTGLRFLAVKYKGSPSTMQDLMGGVIDVTIDGLLASLPQFRAGKIQSLAVTSAQRAAAMNDVKTLDEAGLKGFDLSPWSMIAAPRGTPEPVLALLNARIRDVMFDPEVRETFRQQSGVIVGPDAEQPPAAVNRFVASEVERWGTIIRRAGIKGG